MSNPNPGQTERRKRVLELWAQGLGRKQIALRVGVDVARVTRILTHAGVSDCTHMRIEQSGQQILGGKARRSKPHGPMDGLTGVRD